MSVSKKSKDYELYKEYSQAWKRVEKATISDLTKKLDVNESLKASFVDYIILIVIIIEIVILMAGIFLVTIFQSNMIISIGISVIGIGLISSIAINLYRG